MISRRAFAATVAALVPLAAAGPLLAHGPTRQKVQSQIEINAPLEKVWAAIGNFQDMGWHPAFAKTEGTGGNAPGATRVLTLANGGTINETLTKYDADAKSMAYEITAVDVKVVPVTNYAATLSAKGTADKTIVEWRSSFYRGYVNNDPPPELSDEAAVNAITGVFKTGLEALKKKIEGAG
ncbi:MAG: SRPBCC family protein [Hyphomicrobium sp.]